MGYVISLHEEDLANMYINEKNRDVAFDATMNMSLTKEVRRAKQQRERKEAEAFKRKDANATCWADRIYLITPLKRLAASDLEFPVKRQRMQTPFLTSSRAFLRTPLSVIADVLMTGVKNLKKEDDPQKRRDMEEKYEEELERSAEVLRRQRSQFLNMRKERVMGQAERGNPD